MNEAILYPPQAGLESAHECLLWLRMIDGRSFDLRRPFQHRRFLSIAPSIRAVSYVLQSAFFVLVDWNSYSFPVTLRQGD
jgi:hypothetical protein